MLSVEQRLLAQPVPSQEQCTRGFAPDAEGEHSPKVREAVHPVLLVGVEDRLCVATGRKTMPRSLQFAAKLAKVVDFAVERNPHCAILVAHWLVSGLEIDDGKPSMTESGATASPQPGVIRAAMGHSLEDGLKRKHVNRAAVLCYDACYSAHITTDGCCALSLPRKAPAIP